MSLFSSYAEADLRTRDWPWQGEVTDRSVGGQGGFLGLGLSGELGRGPGVSSHQDLKRGPVLEGPAQALTKPGAQTTT